MKNFVKNWWTSEIARWNRHPRFWTTVLIAYVAYLTSIYYELYKFNKSLESESE